MIGAIASVSHALAALMFAGLALAQAPRWRDAASRTMAVACAATAIWALLTALTGGGAVAARLAETARDLSWLSFLYLLMRRGEGRLPSIDALYGALGFVLAAIVAVDCAAILLPARAPVAQAVLLAAFSLRMIFAVGALVAIHNLYAATASGARAGIGLALGALAAMWAYDLTLYALSWAGRGWATDAAAVRGVVACGVAPALAVAAVRNRGWSVRLSRSAAFRSVALVGALFYLFAVIALATALDTVAGEAAQTLQTGVLLAAALIVATGVASARLRAWSRVMLAKHFLAHRYDYRAEWLRFTETLGQPGSDAAPLEVRVVKAIADIVAAPGGVLLMPDGDALVAGAHWRWSELVAPLDAPLGGTGSELAASLAVGRIVELDPLRAETGDPAEAAAIPEWIVAEEQAWAIVPLVHFDRLAGAVLLARPIVDRALDWEDFDLLRLAGRQVASYLAEAQSQTALSDAARFDEFNRRFAFIMHDIKNLVSQLTLVTRNAERHADKPEFRADMIATLQNSTARMNDLLQRLSQHNHAVAEPPRPTDLRRVAASVAAQHRARHPVVVAGQADVFALADAARLDAALSHLVQNAIDASPPAEPVTVTTVRNGSEAGIEVTDRGVGMTADFVRSALFRPFASTKPGGFGIGAHEARTLMTAMGGRIAVASTPGDGSRFTLWLPSAEPRIERKAA